MSADVRYYRPAPTRPLDFRRSADRALRVTVMRRDGFTCQSCGWAATNVPDDYDGRFTIGPWPIPDERTLHVDHVVPRHKGGPNHPANLQTLCEPCNCVKAGR
jgi:5-methylcytosine-specific restriction endonuclease McrA